MSEAKKKLGIYELQTLKDRYQKMITHHKDSMDAAMFAHKAICNDLENAQKLKKENKELYDEQYKQEEENA
jgi:hypothetical protein